MTTFSRPVAFMLLVLGLAVTRAMAAPGGTAAVAGEAAGKPMKIMTYNILHGAGMDGRWDLWRTAGAIRRAAPDVATLQEVDRGTARSFGADEPAMLACLLSPALASSRFSQSIPLGGGGYGNAIISAEEPVSTRTVPLPGNEPRSLLVCEFADCYVGTAHLALDEASRMKSIELVAGEALAAGKPFFFTGDWNATPDSPELEAIRRHFVILSDAGACTWPADEPTQCIDYVAIDKAHAGNVRVVSAEVPAERVASDHRPVVVSVEITR